MPEQNTTERGTSGGPAGKGGAGNGATSGTETAGAVKGTGAEATQMAELLAGLDLTGPDGTGEARETGRGGGSTEQGDNKHSTKAGTGSSGGEAGSTDQRAATEAEDGELAGGETLEVEPDQAKGGAEDGDEEDEEEDAGDGEREDEGGEEGGHLAKGLKALDKHPELKGLKKRFKQLLKVNPELKRQVAALEKELEEARELPPVRVATGESPLETARNKAEVEALMAEARAVRDFLEDHPEGGKLQVGDREMEIGEGQTAAARKLARKILEDGPVRLKALEETAAVRGRVKAVHPELYQAGHGDHEMRTALLKRVPGLALLNDQDEIVRAYVVGQKMLDDVRAGRASWHRVPKGAGKDKAGAGAVKPGKPPVVNGAAAAVTGAVVSGMDTTPKAQVWERAKQKGGVPIEEMLDAGALV